MNEEEYEQAVKTGLRNNEIIILVRNFCSQARVVNTSGVGMIAQITGLPIGLLGVRCDHAPVTGMASWYLEESAVDFYDRNCAQCDKRVAVQMPNLLKLVNERDRALERQKESQSQARAQSDAAHQNRIAQRATLRNGQSAASCSLLDDLDALDACPSEEVKIRIVETAKLAPEVFTIPIVEYFFELASSGEMNLKEQALSVLQQVCVDKTRLSNTACECLAKHDAIEVAAGIVAAHPDLIAPAKAESAVPALIALAQLPQSRFSIDDPTPWPEPLKAAYKFWPEVVRQAIVKLLDSTQSYPVRLGVAALEVLSKDDAELLPRFARSTISKFARAHLLFEKDPTDPELEMVCGDLRRIIVIALLAAPDNTEVLISEFFKSASSEGEVRLTEVYESLSRYSIRLRRDDGSEMPPANVAAQIVALRRLLTLAGTSSNQKVLRLVVDAFRNEPDEMVLAGKQNIDALLGTAAVLDARIQTFESERSTAPAASFNEQLEAQQSANTLHQLRDSCALIAAKAAKGNETLIHSYVDFLNSIDEHHDGLSSAITKASPYLIDSPHTLNIVLPDLYSSLLGTSVLRRTAAGKAIGELGSARVSDLPELVLEAFVLLLLDQYVMVHQAAVNALSSVALPPRLERRAGSALLQLITYYSGKKDEHNFLVRCIRLHLARFASAEQLQAGLANLFIKFLMTVPASLHTRDFSGMGKKLALAPSFVDLIVHIFSDRELSEHSEENASRLVPLVPDQVAIERADDFVEMVKRQPRRYILVGAAVELLSRVGAWPQAQAVMKASWEAVPDTVPQRRFKWYRRLHVIAVQFEAAVAARDASRQEALQKEWLQLETALKEDEKLYATRRSSLPSFLQQNSGG